MRTGRESEGVAAAMDEKQKVKEKEEYADAASCVFRNWYRTK